MAVSLPGLFASFSTGSRPPPLQFVKGTADFSVRAECRGVEGAGEVTASISGGAQNPAGDGHTSQANSAPDDSTSFGARGFSPTRRSPSPAPVQSRRTRKRTG